MHLEQTELYSVLLGWVGHEYRRRQGVSVIAWGSFAIRSWDGKDGHLRCVRAKGFLTMLVERSSYLRAVLPPLRLDELEGHSPPSSCLHQQKDKKKQGTQSVTDKV